MNNLNQCSSSLWNNLPREPGIYGFVLSNLEPSLIGLPRYGKPVRDVSTYSKQIIRRIERIENLLSNNKYYGSIKDVSKTASVSPVGQVAIEFKQNIPRHSFTQSKSCRALAEKMILVNGLLQSKIILYIGSAINQSIAKRYGQHYADFTERDTVKNTFGARLRATNLAWEDIAHFYQEYPSSPPAEIRDTEKLMISLFQPILSIK